MSDPVVPVERGLRATVRLAAGINIGEEQKSSLVDRLLGRRDRAAAALRDRVAGLSVGLANPLPELSASIDRRLIGSLARHAGLGAAAGAVIVAVGFAALAAQAALSATPATHEITLAIEEVAAKADRLTLPPRLATVAATVGAEVPAAGELATAQGGGTFATASLPTLAFASADATPGDGTAAIDRVIDTPPIGRSIPVETTVDEEDDDEAVVALPMPRARPNIEPTLLPVPRPRPLVLASLTSPNAVVDIPAAPTPTRATPPEERPPSNALGFFSSPTDPVKPPSRTKIDTPFGVPYVLQTGSVETACLKPELVEVLRRIETNYRQKVIITSGFRDRGRQGSLHRQCAAVDIEVPGVAAATLASYARTIPGIGGVGTYCHAHMIHVDIGTPRDWKYGCGSYFAMRGAPGKWGKVPSTLAKAQGTGIAPQVASDAQEED